MDLSTSIVTLIEICIVMVEKENRFSFIYPLVSLLWLLLARWADDPAPLSLSLSQIFGNPSQFSGCKETPISADFWLKKDPYFR